MIVRISHRITSNADASEYQAHLEAEELPARRTAPGNLGAHILRRVDGGRAHFVLLTLWDSPASVRRFLSDEAARAAREGPAVGADLAKAEPFVGDFEVVPPPAEAGDAGDGREAVAAAARAACGEADAPTRSALCAVGIPGAGSPKRSRHPEEGRAGDR